jgi:molybdopterin-binding protein
MSPTNASAHLRKVARKTLAKASIDARLRERLGLSQSECAAVLGVHAMTVSKWERGVSKPNEHQRLLLRALGAAAEAGLRAPTGARRGWSPVAFLGEALALAQGGARIDLGALSATNRFAGKVVEVARGDVMSKVVVEIAPGLRMGAVITTDSVDRLGLVVGSRAQAIVKATEVIVGKG